VQGAVVNVIEPIFERDFAKHSYGFRPKRGCKDALRRVDELLKAGYVHVVDADMKAYFDSIPHAGLMNRLKTKITDGRVLSLIESFLKAGILDGLREWTPETGAPQGAVLSPLLSNIYLDPLDHLLAGSGYEMVRYADDFVILCRTAEEAEKALELTQRWVSENGLELHPTKTRAPKRRAGKDPPKVGGIAEMRGSKAEPDPAGLVRLLPAQQPPQCVRATRRLDSDATSKHLTQTPQRAGSGSRSRQPPLAEPVLR
jgi:group II intron reverse transcriptase/maturase